MKFLNWSARRSPFVACFFFPLFLLNDGCKNSNKCFSGNEVTIPSSDATPPVVIMDAHFSNKPLITLTSTSAGDTVKIGGNDTVTLIEKGTDPQGIKDIQISVEETCWINGSTTGPGLLGAPEASNPDKGV